MGGWVERKYDQLNLQLGWVGAEADPGNDGWTFQGRMLKRTLIVLVDKLQVQAQVGFGVFFKITYSNHTPHAPPRKRQISKIEPHNQNTTG